MNRGFVAASYQRGVRLVHVPTTLLAMVDSAIGGKTGIDLPEGKNYVGAIWQPGLVLMDVTALDTLPARELSAGFAEVIKYGLLEGGELERRIDAWPTLPGERAALTALILDCVAHKLRVVAEDERENGIRASLNLGHTVGHGIEAAAGYERYLHGEAISLGMLAALRLSEQLCGLDPAVRTRSAELFARHGLPTTLDHAVGTDAILAAMGRDKKADASALNMVLIDRPGGSPLAAESSDGERHHICELAHEPQSRAVARTEPEHVGRRPAQHYGTVTLAQLEAQVREWGAERTLDVVTFQTNHEGAFLEHVHGLIGAVDAVVVNPGAWTHYQWSIRDALELLGVPMSRGPPVGHRGP